jgi:hypothetical protein
VALDTDRVFFNMDAPLTTKVDANEVALETFNVEFNEVALETISVEAIVVALETFNNDFNLADPPITSDEFNDTSLVTRKLPEISTLNDASPDNIPPKPVLLFTLLVRLYLVITLSTVVSVTTTMPLFIVIVLELPSLLSV